MHITYIALTPDDRRLAIDCSTLTEALALAEAHLIQGVLPVSIILEGRRFDIEMILALLDQRWERHAGE